MGQHTAIEWADHTFNPWIGCTKVSAGCDHCYAERLAKARLGVAWGPHAARRVTSPSTWEQPRRWNRKAQREGRRARLFCASLADVFDNAAPADARANLWRLIGDTPALDWLLLTKRPQNIAAMLPSNWGGAGYPNVWLGTTAENQQEAERRIPHLLAVPARLRFLSCEPLLGPVDLGSVAPLARPDEPRIHWVITGGESGRSARPMHPDWARNLRDQCQAAGVPFFFKQWGDWLPCVTDHDGERTVCFPTAADAQVFHDENARGRIMQAQGEEFWQVGKKRAGATLDGREWREVPTP
jgi:protein gp37